MVHNHSMKNISILIAIAFLFISATVIYLIRTGVSVRTAPIIRPSPITRNGLNIAQGLVLRLAPEFLTSHYIIWGVLPQTEESENILKMIQDEYEKLHQKKVTVINDAHAASPEKIQNCRAPCWIFVPRDEANEMAPNEFFQKRIRSLGRPYTTISIIYFSKIPEISQVCLEQKRLSYNCLKELAIHEAKRKMKNEQERYFFMKKHLEKDFFLFIQDAPVQ